MAVAADVTREEDGAVDEVVGVRRAGRTRVRLASLEWGASDDLAGARTR
jgi:hypothetical protein